MPGPSGSAGSPGDQGIPVSELVSFLGSDLDRDVAGYLLHRAEIFESMD